MSANTPYRHEEGGIVYRDAQGNVRPETPTERKYRIEYEEELEKYERAMEGIREGQGYDSPPYFTPQLPKYRGTADRIAGWIVGILIWSFIGMIILALLQGC